MKEASPSKEAATIPNEGCHGSWMSWATTESSICSEGSPAPTFYFFSRACQPLFAESLFRIAQEAEKGNTNHKLAVWTWQPSLNSLFRVCLWAIPSEVLDSSSQSGNLWPTESGDSGGGLSSLFVWRLRTTDGGHSVEDSHSGDSNLSPAVDCDVRDLA